MYTMYVISLSNISIKTKFKQITRVKLKFVQYSQGDYIWFCAWRHVIFSVLSPVPGYCVFLTFGDRPVPIFSDVRFSYLALEQDKNHVRFTGKCMLYSLCQLPPNYPCFSFLKKKFTVYKFSIFYKHTNPNNQPYYYIITFTQYTKIRNYFFDWHEGEITRIVYMIVC